MTATVRRQPPPETQPPSWARRQLPRLLALGAAAATVFGALEAAPTRAATATTVSSNWAGYVASRSGRTFRRVSASWVVPTATCVRRNPTYSAVWVGLGGYSSRSQALEQTGVDVDCTAAGRAVYSAWYELLPAGAVTLRMPIEAGDRVQGRCRSPAGRCARACAT